MRKPLLALLVAVLSTGCTWAQFRGDVARTGFQADESKIGLSTVASLSEVWTAPIGSTGSAPVVTGGKVYIGEGAGDNGRGSLSALDAAGRTDCSGTPKVCHELWSVATEVGVHATPAVVNGVAYVVDDDGGVVAYDAGGPDHCGASPSCPLLWVAATGSGGSASPAVNGGVVYVGSTESRLSAIDAAGSTNCSPTQFGLKDCKPLWTASTDSPVAVSVAVARGVVYAISQAGTLYAYDAAGRENCAGTPKVCAPLWTAPVGGPKTLIGSSPVVSGGSVYTMNDGSRLLRAFDAAGMTNCSGTPRTCAPLWTAPVPASPSDSSSDAAAVAYGHVYVGSAVFDAGGVTNCAGTPKVCGPLWRVSGGGQYPVVANGLEFVGPSLPTTSSAPFLLQAFDATGASHCSGTPTVCAPLWTVDLDFPMEGSPAIVNGALFVATIGDPLGFFAPGTLHVYAPG